MDNTDILKKQDELLNMIDLLFKEKVKEKNSITNNIECSNIHIYNNVGTQKK